MDAAIRSAPYPHLCICRVPFGSTDNRRPGIPGRVWCELSEAEIAANRHNGEVYRRLLDIH